MAPIFKLQLNTAGDHVFVPGSTVSGTVILRNEKDEDIESVFVRFYGKSRVKIPHGDNKYHRHRVVLFNLQRVLFKGPFKLRAGEHTWPISFTFPERCDRDCKTDFNEAEGRFVSGPQLLPPSCHLNENDKGGDIEYKIKAKIPRTFHSWKVKRSLYFTPARAKIDIPPAPRALKACFSQKYRVGDNGQARALKMRESLKDTFHSHTETKSVDIHVQLQTPTSIIIGDRLNPVINLKVETDEDILPEVTFKSASLVLKSTTYIRAPGTFSDHVTDGDSHCMVASKQMNASMPLNCPVELNDLLPIKIRTRIQSLEYDSSLGVSVPPSFSSYNVRRTYQLEWRFNFLCVEKEHHITLKAPGITLYSQKLDESCVTTGASNLAEVPPAYDHADVNGDTEAPTEILPAYAKEEPKIVS